MKSKIYKTAVLLLLAGLIAAVFYLGWPQYVRYSSDRAVKSVNRHAHEITSVEVLTIKEIKGVPEGDRYELFSSGRYAAVTGRHVLTGHAASEVVHAWGRIRLTNGLVAGCHEPAFVVRFFAGRRKVFEMNVCFDCENISYKAAPFQWDTIQMITTKYDAKSGYDDFAAILTKLQ
jgi:hypothetical protein